MSENKKYVLKISGDKFSHEQEIDNIQKAKIISFLMLPDSNLIPINKSIPTQEGGSHQAISPNSIRITSREYINEKNPATAPQKIAVFAGFLKDIKKQEFFTKEDIKQQFEEAKESLDLNNYNRDFNITLKKGWLSKNTKGEYYLTGTGENGVKNNKFERSTKRGIYKKRNGQKKSSSTIRKEIENLEITPSVPGYKYYWKLNKGDRVLWILAQAHDKGITDLSSKEISALSEKLSDLIESKQITALVASHIKFERMYPRVINNIKVLKISQPGIDYIKNSQSNGEVT